MIVTEIERCATAGTKGGQNFAGIMMAIQAEQGRVGRRKLLCAAQAAGWEEQLLQSQYAFVEEGHGL